LMSMRPAIQSAPGKYDESLLRGLDFLLAEMGKRNMKAVLYLNNFWQWSGGMSQYVAWVSGEPIIDPDTTGDWPGFVDQSASFYKLPEAQSLYRQFIEMLIMRKNTVTGVLYRDDPTIMSWQLANEPRPGDHGKKREEYQPFVQWVHETARFIRERAPHQLISTGSEGSWGSVNDEQLYIDAHDTPYIDYLTFHLWVKNWSWFDVLKPEETFAQGLENSRQYIQQHIEIASGLNKPTVMEEFGVERDGADYRLSSTTVYRDKFYREYFEQIYRQAADGKPVMGVNFLSWGGTGRAQHEDLVWREGDPFVGDPPQEPQGLNSVFAEDISTLAVIKQYAEVLGTLSIKSR
jgi:mannan endo-1,4-beta-mannosidase